MPPGYGYYAPPMQPQYAPEYTPEYAPQYPPRYAPQYAPPPALPTYSGDPPPGPPPQGWMPHRPVMMPQHQMPADPRPTIHQQPPIQPIQPLGAPHLPAGIPGPVVKDIRWMQRHLDDAVGIIGRKAGEPAEFDTIGSDWRLANGYDPELAKRTVVDLSDYTQVRCLSCFLCWWVVGMHPFLFYESAAPAHSPPLSPRRNPSRSSSRIWRIRQYRRSASLL